MTLLARLRNDGIAWEDRFLSEEDCARLVDELRFAFWSPSTVVNRFGNGEVVAFQSHTRRSETTSQEWFTDDALRDLTKIERRLCRRLDLRRRRLEPWQATRYRRGGRFEAHNDAGLFGHEPGGERTTTLLLYLEAPARGGSTSFPELEIELRPRVGRLVVWENLSADGNVNPAMVHAASPVNRGVKTTLTTWCRQAEVR